MVSSWAAATVDKTADWMVASKALTRVEKKAVERAAAKAVD